MCLNSKILTRTTHMILIKKCVCGVFCKKIYTKKMDERDICAHHDKIIKTKKAFAERTRSYFSIVSITLSLAIGF